MMMTKFKNWRILFLLATLPILMACGDDENDSGQKADGINVSNGKKITELSLLYNGVKDVGVFNVDYDAKGRLSKITYKYSDYNYFISLDYDLRVVTISETRSGTISYGFFINDDGYVSQLGTCSLTYKDGYLVGTEIPKAIGQITYDSNELIKASLSNIIDGSISFSYITYGNIENQGELIINVQSSDEEPYNLGILDIAAFIAYESGLFGKVSKSFVQLKNENETSYLFNYSNKKYNHSFRLKFKCE